MSHLCLEAQRLFQDHLKSFHKGKGDCVICRSLRRTILREVVK